jgi:hypothetical protein
LPLQVIKNQELRDVSEELLQAIIDPVTKIPTCLKTLLNTKFVHFIGLLSIFDTKYLLMHFTLCGRCAISCAGHACPSEGAKRP